MTMNGRKKNDIRHSNMLRPSSQDLIVLILSIETRFLDLTHAYLRITGVQLPIPESLNADLLLWRTLRVRHKKGDHRNTEDEVKAIKNIAQWSLDENNKLRNQPPIKLEWGDM